MHTESFFHKRRNGKRIALAFILIFVTALVVVGLSTLAIVDGIKRGEVARSAIFSAQTAIVERDFASATEYLSIAYGELSLLNRRLQILEPMTNLPWLGSQVEALLLLAKDGSEALDVIRMLADIGIDIDKDLQSVGLIGGIASLDTYAELTPEARMELVFALNRAVPDLEEARARLGQQRRDLERVDANELFFGLRFVRNELLSQIRTIDNSLQLMVPILSVLPTVSGFKGEQNYLMLLQNTGELRPTGGFWGTYGVLTLRDGEIVEIVSDDIYAVDAPAVGAFAMVPPDPLKRYLGADNWYLRDANWSPDVPTSIKRALEFYKIETSVAGSEKFPVTAPKIDFDGAILITPEVAVTLLKLFGDVQIDNVQFTPENFFSVLEFEVEQAFITRGIPVTERKDVIGKLIGVLFERFRNADSQQLSALVEGTLTLLDENDILLYSQDSAVQQVFERQAWSGDLRINAQHDHLMFVDANLAALKTDAEMNRAYTYSVHSDVGGDLIASAQINYDHIGGFDYRTTRYRTYTRVYVPLGSQLIEVNGSLLDDKIKNPSGAVGAVDVSEEFGATVFGTFTSIEPGSTGRLEFVYRLPERISETVDNGSYVLDVQKQPGVKNVALNLDLDFNRAILSAQPEEISEYWYDDSYTYTTKASPFKTFKVDFK